MASALSMMRETYLPHLWEITMTGRQVVEDKEDLSSAIVEKPEENKLYVEDMEKISPNIVENQGN